MIGIELVVPSADAFRYGILNALDISLSAKLESEVRAKGTELANSSQPSVRSPYLAGRTIAETARKEGREAELLVPGATSMDADPALAAAYASGWKLAQQRGATPAPISSDKLGSKEKWLDLAKRTGFAHGQMASAGTQPASSGEQAGQKSWLAYPIDLPVVGPVPRWGIIGGIVGLVGVFGYIVRSLVKSVDPTN